MESIAERNHSREKALNAWLVKICQSQPISIEKMQGDASFRRYFRVYTQAGTLVAMDAPPDSNYKAYIAITNGLRKMGLNTPEILAADLENGFLLITDFGQTTYLRGLSEQNADQLYDYALNALAIMQGCRQVENYTIPFFTKEWMLREWAWHKEWFSEKLLGIQLGEQEKAMDACMQTIIDLALSQPQVFMHRDYHSGNLMVLEKGGVGVLDFQDAFIGPITYDLVSLLRDCYINWQDEAVKRWVYQYWAMLHRSSLSGVDQAQFLYWFDWMGVQRHLKALMTFARKALRDEQPAYLQFVPRTLNYLVEVSQSYPELKAIQHYLEASVMPAFSPAKVKDLSCEQ